MTKGTLGKIAAVLLGTLIVVSSIAVGYFVGRSSVTADGELRDTVDGSASIQTEVPGATVAASDDKPSEPFAEEAETTAGMTDRLGEVEQANEEALSSDPGSPATPGPIGEEIGVEEFSLSTSSQTAPEDVLLEIAEFQPGAGGGGLLCWSEDGKPALESSIDEEYELNQTVRVTTCGWAENETVTIIVERPDGSLISESKQAGPSDVGLQFTFDTDLTDTPGVYTFTFEGKSGGVQSSTVVKVPDGPRVYREGEDSLLLYNFQPNERVRLLAYERDFATDSYEFVAWDEFSVNSNGHLLIQLKNPSSLARHIATVVVGDISGQVTGSPGVFPGYLKSRGRGVITVRQCPESTCSILWTGSNPVRVTGEPQASQDCAICFWWPVLLHNGEHGWVNSLSVNHVGISSPFAPDGSYRGNPLTKFDVTWAGGSNEWHIWPTETLVECNDIDQTIEQYLIGALYDGSFYPEVISIPFPEKYRVAAGSMEDGWAFRVDAVVEKCPELEIP